MSDEAVCRTAPATPGLLNITKISEHGLKQIQQKLEDLTPYKIDI